MYICMYMYRYDILMQMRIAMNERRRKVQLQMRTERDKRLSRVDLCRSEDEARMELLRGCGTNFCELRSN